MIKGVKLFKLSATMFQLCSKQPSVKLVKAFLDPYNNAVATARTCYSSRIISDADVQKDEKSRILRDNIAQSTYQAGHHTTLQHAHFQFTIEQASRHSIWSFLHAHPFYNSEQVSQRYVEVKPDRVLIPQFKDPVLQNRYVQAVERQMAAYQELNALLHPAAETAYFDIYKGRQKAKEDKRWQSAIQKRCQEVARYVLPIATHTHLYHTISGLTLHRYHRIAQCGDCPTEQRWLIEAMVEEVNRFDPLFFQHIESILDKEHLQEEQFLKWLFANGKQDATASAVRQMEAQLDGKVAKLLHITSNAEALLSEAFRQVFGVAKEAVSDALALEWLLDPSKNTYLAESLNLNTLSKATRVLELVHVTFLKKLSHCADSQAQRHRMIPGARPLLWTHVTGEPDYVLPSLFEHELAKKAKDVFIQEMQRTFEDICFFKKAGVDPEIWQYLLPNAFPVRYIDTASLLDHHHKWSSRLCYNAQEEIWNASYQEVLQVEQLYPSIGKWLLPPCGLRAIAQKTPVCPEGIRFCGVPVWRLPKSKYQRLL